MASDINIRKLAVPGGFFSRILRLITKGVPLYPDIQLSLDDTLSANDLLEEVTVNDFRVASKEERELFYELEKYEFISIYLHGSRADKTETAFSDYDDLIIIETEFLKKKNMKELIRDLNKVDRKFMKKDPFQHHGHWIVDKKSLSNYDASYIPPCVLKESVIIKGGGDIIFCVNKTKTNVGLAKNIDLTLKSILESYDMYMEGNSNLYNLKSMASAFVLMPALIMQLKGRDVCKKEAINLCETIFSKDTINCINWASSIRDDWGYVFMETNVKLFIFAGKFIINPHFNRLFSMRFSPKIRKIKYCFPVLGERSVKSFKEDVSFHVNQYEYNI